MTVKQNSLAPEQGHGLAKMQFVLLVDFPFRFQTKGRGLLGLCRLFLVAQSGLS